MHQAEDEGVRSGEAEPHPERALPAETAGHARLTGAGAWTRCGGGGVSVHIHSVRLV